MGDKMFAVETVKKKCEICGKEVEFETAGIPTSIIDEIFHLKTGEAIGIMLGNHFICKDCFNDAVNVIISLCRKGKNAKKND